MPLRGRSRACNSILDGAFNQGDTINDYAPPRNTPINTISRPANGFAAMVISLTVEAAPARE